MFLKNLNENRKKIFGWLADSASNEWKVSGPIVYLIGFVIFFLLISSVAMTARNHWHKRLLKAAKIRIAELESEKDSIEYKVRRKLGTKCIKLTEREVKKIDKKIKDIEKEKKKISKVVGRMTRKQLLEAFNQEGIK